MPQLLKDLLPETTVCSGDELLEQFLTYVEEKGMELYPSQESAILELYDNKNVILNTPTGSGKSLVATAGLFKAVAEGKRAVYTCPIKALVNEKWMHPSIEMHRFFVVRRRFLPTWPCGTDVRQWCMK